MSATQWGKKRLRGQVYDLGHLNPFAFEAIPGDENAPRIGVAVSFDLHTFTRKREEGDRPDLHMGMNGDPRSFCVDRYRCSEYLPRLIRSIAAGKVFLSHGGNFLAVGMIPVVEGEYAAVLQLATSMNDAIPVRMRVISAHERKNLLGKMEAISFYTLVRKIAAGEKPPWHKKK